jgi:Family of unknown function (DUF6186)
MTASQVFVVTGFALAAVLLVAVEWTARREDSQIPTMGELCGLIMQYEVARLPVGRIGVLGLWWWVGWHFFAR